MSIMKYIIFLLFLISASAHAEIYQLAIPGEAGMKFYWWPVLPDIEGWHHDRVRSLQFRSNAQAPDGFNFSNAETVIYSKALYKPRTLELTTLEELIKNDQKEFQSRDENISIKEVKPLKTGDGKIMKSFTFSPVSKGNWEQVSYGEEGDFYLIFTISSTSENGFKDGLKYYEQFISNYREKP